MDIPHGSDGTFPREGPWLGKPGLAAAGLMIGVALGMSISPWTVPPPQDARLGAMPAGVTPAPSGAAADGAPAASLLLATQPAAAPAEVQGMELCWGGIEPVNC